MAISNITYSPSENIVITLASLANNAARQSNFIDNSTNTFLDAMVQLNIQLATGTPGNDRLINVWFYGSENGINYTDNATGSDSALTLRAPTNLRGPYIIATPDSGGLVYRAVIGSIAAYFGGVLPRRWGIVVQNRTGIAFDGTETNHVKSYTGIKLTST